MAHNERFKSSVLKTSQCFDKLLVSVLNQIYTIHLTKHRENLELKNFQQQRMQLALNQKYFGIALNLGIKKRYTKHHFV